MAIRVRGARALMGRQEVFLPDFEISRGKRLALVGPNGCGKTALIEVLAGLRPFRGTVEVLGAPPSPGPHVGVVLEQASLPAHVPVDSALRALFHRKEPSRDGALAAGRVHMGVSDLAAWGIPSARRPHELSAGQRTRADIVRAMVPDPAVVLLDETLSHLDAQGLERLDGVIGGRTVLHVAPVMPAAFPGSAESWDVRLWEVSE